MPNSSRDVIDQTGRMSIIVAAADNGVIGRDGAMPWHIPGDLRRFQSKTTGHAVLLGRKTFENTGHLAGRLNLVLSGDPESVDVDPGVFDKGLVKIHEDLDGALLNFIGSGHTRLFCCGGAQVYEECLPMAGEVYMTRVHAEPDGDARFPDVNLEDRFTMVRELDAPRHERDEAEMHGESAFDGAVPYTYRRWVRDDLVIDNRAGVGR